MVDLGELARLAGVRPPLGAGQPVGASSNDSHAPHIHHPVPVATQSPAATSLNASVERHEREERDERTGAMKTGERSLSAAGARRPKEAYAVDDAEGGCALWYRDHRVVVEIQVLTHTFRLAAMIT